MSERTLGLRLARWVNLGGRGEREAEVFRTLWEFIGREGFGSHPYIVQGVV